MNEKAVASRLKATAKIYLFIVNKKITVTQFRELCDRILKLYCYAKSPKLVISAFCE